MVERLRNGRIRPLTIGLIRFAASLKSSLIWQPGALGGKRLKRGLLSSK